MGQELKQIRTGSVYILRQCPPLHGETKKDRPVVVIAPIPGYGKLLIVAISSTVKATVRDRIALPDKTTDAQTTTGLDEPCWAVPAWYMHVRPERLGAKKIGFLSEPLRIKLTLAVIARINAGFPRVPVEEDATKEAD